MPPPPSPLSASSSEVQAPARNLFPFSHKPNTLDRDHIVVPAGWDSWGKISVLRDGFNAKMWGEAWERDLEGEDAQPGETSAKKAYANLVPDHSAKVSLYTTDACWIKIDCTMPLLVQPPPLPPFNNPMPEQSFLAKNYDENAKKSDRDPRGAFRNPAEGTAGLVGPLGSSSFSLPGVERALSEMESGSSMGGAGASLSADAARRLAAARSGATAPGRPAGLAALGPSSPTSLSASRSPISPAGPSPGPGSGSSHEVLHNFFQSLLSNKDRSAAGGTGLNSSPTKRPTNGTHSNGADVQEGS